MEELIQRMNNESTVTFTCLIRYTYMCTKLKIVKILSIFSTTCADVLWKIYDCTWNTWLEIWWENKNKGQKGVEITPKFYFQRWHVWILFGHSVWSLSWLMNPCNARPLGNPVTFFTHVWLSLKLMTTLNLKMYVYLIN